MKKNMSKEHKIYIGVITLIVIIIGSLFIFQERVQQEIESIKIDRYNFGELDKAKIVLDTMNKNDKELFKNLSYKEKANFLNIVPVKNCYHITHYNGRYPYIFGFQLKSISYKIMYRTKNYAYPIYDIPVRTMCLGGYQSRGNENKGGCFDANMVGFEKNISNPCEE